MTAYYNDNDPFCCAWLESLIAENLIPWGVVDCRPIQEIKPDEIRNYTQVHLFAGIGGWGYALRLAGWPEDRRVWTGSCPCQPFSVAGKRKGTKDKRHLWPEMRRLIRECRSEDGENVPVVFGEQVASRGGRDWLSRVRTDLVSLDYEVGCANIPSLAVGTPHHRRRLWFVAYSNKFRFSEPATRETTFHQKLHVETYQQTRHSIGGSISSGVQLPWTPGPGEVYKIPTTLDGLPGGMDGIRAVGNTIVPQLGAEFIRASALAMKDYAAL